MSAHSTRQFLDKAPHDDPAFAWDRSALGGFGAIKVPPQILGQHDGLLHGDQSRLWLRWYLEGVASPRAYVEDVSKTWSHVYQAVFPKIVSAFPHDMGSDVEDLATAVSDHLYSEIKRLRLIGRKDATLPQRRSLIQSATPPRCYLCGFAFSKEAIERFQRVKGANPIACPDRWMFCVRAGRRTTKSP